MTVPPPAPTPATVLAAAGFATEGPRYEAGRALWNAAVPHRPAGVLHCTTVGDVQTGVRVAREHGIPLAVRGGGHGWTGAALAADGLTLDLSGMRQVRLDPQARVAHVSGGATAADVVAAAAAHGLVAVTGTSGSVGMVGLTLGGGYGPLSGRFGLAVDSVLAVDLVLADGSAVTADPEREPDLFWALRGAGGNFGVVTGLRIRLHEVPALLSGMIMYPAEQSAVVLAELAGRIPGGTAEALTVQSGFVTAPDGAPVLFVSPTWCGDPQLGEKEIDTFTRLGDPVAAQAGPVTQLDQLAGIDALFPPGRHIDIGTRTVAALTPAVRETLVAGGTGPTSPLSAISLHTLHGAATRIPAHATAFGMRDTHLTIELIAAWEPGDPAAFTHRAWARDLAAALDPHALPGGYANLLGPADADRAVHAYGDNAERLLAVKRTYDPDGIFHAIPFPAPAAG